MGYTVRPGDSPARIARLVFDDPRAAGMLYQYNPEFFRRDANGNLVFTAKAGDVLNTNFNWEKGGFLSESVWNSLVAGSRSIMQGGTLSSSFTAAGTDPFAEMPGGPEGVSTNLPWARSTDRLFSEGSSLARPSLAESRNYALQRNAQEMLANQAALATRVRRNYALQRNAEEILANRAAQALFRRPTDRRFSETQNEALQRIAERIRANQAAQALSPDRRFSEGSSLARPSLAEIQNEALQRIAERIRANQAAQALSPDRRFPADADAESDAGALADAVAASLTPAQRLELGIADIYESEALERRLREQTDALGIGAAQEPPFDFSVGGAAEILGGSAAYTARLLGEATNLLVSALVGREDVAEELTDFGEKAFQQAGELFQPAPVQTAAPDTSGATTRMTDLMTVEAARWTVQAIQEADGQNNRDLLPSPMSLGVAEQIYKGLGYLSIAEFFSPTIGLGYTETEPGIWEKNDEIFYDTGGGIRRSGHYSRRVSGISRGRRIASRHAAPGQTFGLTTWTIGPGRR